MGTTTRPTPIVRQVVDRCHVSDSPREVIRYVRSRLSGDGRSPEHREARRDIYRQAVEQHRRNRADYEWVQAGCPPRARCVECDRVFDLTDTTDADEWAHGHDCEA
jgi:hypothetical protein